MTTTPTPETLIAHARRGTWNDELEAEFGPLSVLLDAAWDAAAEKKKFTLAAKLEAAYDHLTGRRR